MNIDTLYQILNKTYLYMIFLEMIDILGLKNKPINC